MAFFGGSPGRSYDHCLDDALRAGIDAHRRLALPKAPSQLSDRATSPSHIETGRARGQGKARSPGTAHHLTYGVAMADTRKLDVRFAFIDGDKFDAVNWVF